MKISSIRSRILVLPEADPLADTPENPNAARPIVIVRIGTDDGVEGIAVSFYGGSITAALKRAIDDLGALTIGEDPHRIEGIVAKLRAAAGGSGPAGMFTLALSAIDIALWDIRGKALGVPLWKLLGGARQRIATYASGALRRNLTLDEVVTAAGTLKQKGFREAKMQLALPGDPSPAKEVERAVKLREALGPDIKLMCDINQRWR
ncbi:MAG: enolase C-terminal domain-like protein, partial [Stellaceae bacterium]